jgi:uncharacterized protein (TIGR03382 family)
MKLSMTLAFSLALVGGAMSANGAIVGVTGQAFWLVSPPVSAMQFALIGPPAFTWNEQTNVNVSNLPVNLTVNPGVYTGFTPYAGLVSGMFDSHMIHFDASAGANVVLGSVTFSQPIAAVIYDNILLDLTDASLGNPSTTYDTGNSQRSPSAVLGPSVVQLLGNTLRFDLIAMMPGNHMVELRVLTHAVPTPGTMGLASLTGLLALRRRRR